MSRIARVAASTIWLITCVAALGVTALWMGCATTGAALCERDVVMSGDLVRFVEGQMISYGCEQWTIKWPKNRINCSWRFRSDAGGVQIFTRADHFKDFDEFIRAAFGTEPDISRAKYVAYSVQHLGAGIAYTVAKGPYPPAGPSFVTGEYLHIVIPGAEGRYTENWWRVAP